MIDIPINYLCPFYFIVQFDLVFKLFIDKVIEVVYKVTDLILVIELKIIDVVPFAY